MTEINKGPHWLSYEERVFLYETNNEDKKPKEVVVLEGHTIIYSGKTGLYYFFGDDGNDLHGPHKDIANARESLYIFCSINPKRNPPRMNYLDGELTDSKIEEILDLIKKEYFISKKMHGDFPSDHHGYAIVKEEVDELWDEVKKKESFRDVLRMKEEAIQVAAMALRFVLDRCINRDR